MNGTLLSNAVNKYDNVSLWLQIKVGWDCFFYIKNMAENDSY